MSTVNFSSNNGISTHILENEAEFPVYIPQTSSLWKALGSSDQNSKSVLVNSVEDVSENRLLVENINPCTRKEVLENLFNNIGKVELLEILNTKTGHFPAVFKYAVVTFFLNSHDHSSALEKIAKYCKTLSSKIRVLQISKPSFANLGQCIRITGIKRRKCKELLENVSHLISFSSTVVHDAISLSAVLNLASFRDVVRVIERRQNLSCCGNRLVVTAQNEEVIDLSTGHKKLLSFPEIHCRPYRPLSTCSCSALNSSSSEDAENALYSGTCHDLTSIQESDSECELVPHTVCLVGLPCGVKKHKLMELFSQQCYGTLAALTLHKKIPPAHAYASFSSASESKRAVAQQHQVLKSCYLNEALHQISVESESNVHSNDVFEEFSLLCVMTLDVESPIDFSEVPPNTVLVVGGLGGVTKAALEKVFKPFGRILGLFMFTETFPVHAYIVYCVARAAEEVIMAQPQINMHRKLLTVPAQQKYTFKELMQLEAHGVKLETPGSSVPLFYRQKMELPAWARYFYSAGSCPENQCIS